MHHVAVRDRDTLGHAGGPGGVDDVRDVVGAGPGSAVAGHGGDPGIVDPDDRHAEPATLSARPAEVTTTTGAASASMNSIRAGAGPDRSAGTPHPISSPRGSR